MNHIRPVFLMLAFTSSMLFSAGITVTPAAAASIQYSFTGSVNKVQNGLKSTFVVDTSPTAMSGLMTVNENDLDTSARFGAYTITDFSLKIVSLDTDGYYEAGKGTFNQVQIRNGLPGKDEFNVAVVSPTGDPVGPRVPSLFEIQLRGPASIFGNDDLPTTSPSIGDFNKKQWRLVFVPGSKQVSGVITAMTVVPLPAAVILFGAGLVALVGLGAGGWRQKKNSFA